MVEVELVARIRAVDLAVLLDITASMGEELDRLKSTFSSEVAPELARTIDEPRIGVATVGDELEYEPVGGGPFFMRQGLTADTALLDAAIDAIELTDGGDGPEGQVIALFHTATGAYEDSYIHPVECPAGEVGAFCFGPTALRLIVLATDAAFHNGPGGAYPYLPGRPTFEQAAQGLRDADVHVLGLYSGAPGAEGYEHLVATALASDATLDSEPLVLDIGRDGAGLDRSFVELVGRFVDERPLDVLARVRPGRDASIVTGLELTAIEPADAGTRVDAVRAAGVVPGALLRLDARVDPRRASAPGRADATIELIGNGRLLLDEAELSIETPASAEHCL